MPSFNFSPSAGSGGSGVDASIVGPASGTFSGARNAVNGFFVDTSDIVLDVYSVSSSFRVVRSCLVFDISSLSGATILSATLNLYSNYVQDSDGDSLRVVTFAPTATNNISLSDFDITKYGSTALTNDITLAAFTIGSYHVFTFNGTGLTYLNSDANFAKLSVRSLLDVNNVPPTSASNSNNYISADNLSGFLPILSVTTAGAGASSLNLLTLGVG